MLFPFFWAVETWIVWRLTNPWIAAVFLASLPVSGLLAYRYLGGLAGLRDRLRFGLLSLTRHHAARRLLIHRGEILEELERAKADYLTATHGSSF